jgi:hypothetical protein
MSRRPAAALDPSATGTVFALADLLEEFLVHSTNVRYDREQLAKFAQRVESFDKWAVEAELMLEDLREMAQVHERAVEGKHCQFDS